MACRTVEQGRAGSQVSAGEGTVIRAFSHGSRAATTPESPGTLGPGGARHRCSNGCDSLLRLC